MLEIIEFTHILLMINKCFFSVSPTHKRLIFVTQKIMKDKFDRLEALPI